MSDMDHPGATLKKLFLDPIGLTPYRLAKAMGVQQTRLSQIIHGKRSITADTAVRLGAFFGAPPRWFMDIQVRWDLDRAAGSSAGVEPLSIQEILVTPRGARRVEAATNHDVEPTMKRVSSALRKRLEAQAGLAPAREPREVEEVRYESGMRGIVGVDP
jgi:addiction module HigA family antidote